MKSNILPAFLILTLGFIFIGFVTIKTKADTKPQTTMNEQMKTHHHSKVADDYLRGLNEKNLELILSLYADNATVEDPVGSEIISGKSAVREFYSGAATMDLNLTRTGPVRVAGVEAAFPFQLRMEVGGVPMVTDIIDVFRFDAQGKIVSMRAFWGPENQRPATE